MERRIVGSGGAILALGVVAAPFVLTGIVILAAKALGLGG